MYIIRLKKYKHTILSVAAKSMRHILLYPLLFTLFVLPSTAQEHQADTTSQSTEMNNIGIFGNLVIPVNEKYTFRMSGVDLDFIYFHPVTGVGLEESIALDADYDDIDWTVAGTLGYAFSAKEFEGSIDAEISSRKNTFRVTAGKEFADWKRSYGERRFINSFTTLFAKNNYKALVDNYYYNVTYIHKPSTEWNIEAELEGIDLSTMHNNTDFSFFHHKKHYKPNAPVNQRVTKRQLMGDNQTSASVRASYTHATNTTSTVYGLGATQGILIGDSRSNYTHICASVRQVGHTADDNSFDWNLAAGTHINGDSLNFFNWKHFYGSDKFFGTSHYRYGYIGFVMFDPYELSTNGWYVYAAGHYESNKLLLKRLKWINDIPYTEELYLKSAAIDGKKLYTEVGYGLNNVLYIMRVTAFASFIGSEFQSVGIHMCVALKKWSLQPQLQ